MRCLAFVSLLLLYSCASRHLVPGHNADTCDMLVRPQSDLFEACGIEIRYGELSVSGIILLVSDNKPDIRFVMLAETGPTLIDLYLTRNGYTKNYVYKKLDRKIILKLLHEDIGIVTGLFADKNRGYKSNELNVCCYPVKKNVVLCYESDSDSDLPVKAVLTEKGKKKTTVNYYYSNSSIPDSIGILHHRINMQLTLYKKQ